jgi:hypothetical protein
MSIRRTEMPPALADRARPGSLAFVCDCSPGEIVAWHPSQSIKCRYCGETAAVAQMSAEPGATPA